MKFANATNLNRKSGVAEARNLQSAYYARRTLLPEPITNLRDQ
jgi:hypothetical protein